MTKEKEPPTIKDLYPHMNDEELRIAEYNLRQYLALTLRIHERICADPVEYAKFKKLLERERNRQIQDQT